MFLSAPSLPDLPQRIISLVPSQTELLHDLGLGDRVAGITRFCIYPDTWFRSKIRIGGTKNPDLEKIRSLSPDLIIANREENVREHVEALAGDFPVWVTDVRDLPSAIAMIRDIGRLTGTDEKSNELAARIESEFTSITEAPSGAPVKKVAYLIWKDPYMTVGGDTFISSMLSRAGFMNVFADRERYPQVTVEEIRDSGCELVFLSSEPYPFDQKHAEELAAEIPGCRVLLVEGDMFSWYGSRLLQAPGYFLKIRQQADQVMR